MEETGAEKEKAWEENNFRQHWQVSNHTVTGTTAHGEEGILLPSQFTVQEHKVIAGRHGVRDPPPLGLPEGSGFVLPSSTPVTG